METMKLWDQVYQTDPAATKSAKVNGQQITSIGGHHMVKRATEIFGPVGIGWGWTIVEERLDQGGPVRNQEGETIGHEVGHVIRIRLWFTLDGQKGEVESYGCTPFSYRSKYGITTDTEAPKKSLTDAVKKALSMLGFSADIFLGLFDDLDYVAERTEQAAIEKAEDKEAAIEKQKQDRLDWLKTALDTMRDAVTAAELRTLHNKYVRDTTRRKEDKFTKRIAQEYEELSKKFENEEQAA